MLLRKLVAKETPQRSLAPAISREDHSSSAPSAFACSGGAPALREVSRDMEQNSEENRTAPASLRCFVAKTLAELPSANVLPGGPSSVRAKCWPKVVRPTLCDEASAAMQEHGFWQAELFCGISTITNH